MGSPHTEVMNIGPGRRKGILSPGEITISNRAQIPIFISGQLAETGCSNIKRLRNVPSGLPALPATGGSSKINRQL